MKRFTYIFILLYTFILTLGVVNSFNESYFNRLQFLPVEFKYQTEKDSLVLNLYLKENDLTENDAMKGLLHLAKENNLEVMVTLEHKDILGRSVKSTYIYSDKFKLNNVAYLEKEIDINFSDEKQKGYISSDPLDDKKTGGIRFLSSKYTRGKEYPVLRFLPMHSFDENNEASVNFFAPTIVYDKEEVTKNNLIKKIQEVYPFLNPMEIYESEQFSEDMEMETASLTDYLPSIMLLIILLTATSHVNGSIKEISIRKLQGNSSKIIFMRIMKSYIRFIVLYYIIGTVFSYFILGGDFSSISLNIIRPVIGNMGNFMLILIIFMMLTYGYIYYIGNFVALKRSKSRMTTVYMNLLLKMILIILILAPLAQEMQSGADALVRVYHYTKSSEDYEGKYMVNLATSLDFYVDPEDDRQSDFQKLLFNEFILNNEGFYADFSSAYWPPQAVEGFLAGGLMAPYPSISADYNFLRKYKIRDEEGKEIDLSRIKENTVFIPMNLKDVKDQIYNQTYNQITHSVPNVMYVSFDKPFLNPDVGSSSLFIEDPVVNYMVEYVRGVHVTYTSALYSSQTKLQNILDQSAFKDFYQVEAYEPIYAFYLNGYWETFMESTFFLLMFSLIPLIFLYQSLSFHLSETKKEIALKYSMGSSFIKRYREILLLHLLPYGVLIFAVITSLKIPKAIGVQMILYYIVLDLMFMMIILRKFERKSVAEILKGE